MGNICSNKAFLALFLTVFTLIAELAQNGILKGTIKGATTQEGVIGGTVRLAGTTLAERDDQSTNNIRLGAVQNFSLMLDNGDKLEFRNLFNQLGRNQLTTRDGYDNEGTQVRKSYAMGYQGRNEPDLRRVAYSVRPAGTAEGKAPTETVLTPAAGQVDVNNAGRLFQKLGV